MGIWTNINDSNDKFRLLCNDAGCSLSLCNLLNGRLHITTIHGDKRHSLTFSEEDMKFIVSQYLNNLSELDRAKMLDFFKNF